MRKSRTGRRSRVRSPAGREAKIRDMALLRRPLPRFFVWVTILVAVAVVTAVAGLAWWLIAAIELAAWVGVSFVERAAWRGSLRPAPAPVPEQTPVETTTAVTLLSAAPAPPIVVAKPPAPAQAQRRRISRPSTRTMTV